jgi:ankyrin repeat protein
MYHDAWEIYELLDKFNYQGPPKPYLMAQLFSEKPDEARRRFSYGYTLLHKAVKGFSSHSDVIDVLLSAYPEALVQIDDTGFLPIHQLLLETTSWGDNICDLVKRFISSYPETILAITPCGKCPLHIACSMGASRDEIVDVVRYLIDCFPDACFYRNKTGKLPIQLQLEAIPYPRVEIIQMLIDTYPLALSFTDAQNNLPIHWLLAQAGQSYTAVYDKTIEALISGFEGSLRIQNAKGETPLFQACTNDNSLSNVYCLVRSWPEQVTPQCSRLIFDSESYNGELLFPSLASKFATLEQVKHWLHRHQDAYLYRDLRNRLPIHYCVISQSPEAFKIVHFLLNHEKERHAEQSASVPPKQLSASDNDGRLPLHFASASPSTPPKILQLLIDEYPEGLQKEDVDNRLPWHYADCARQDLVFEMSTRMYPEMEVDLDLVPDEIRWDLLSYQA